MIMKVPVENFVELNVSHQFLQSFPFLNHIYKDITLDTCLDFISTKQKQGHQFFALYHDTHIVALASINWCMKRKNVYVQGLITEPCSVFSDQYIKKVVLDSLYEWITNKGADSMQVECLV
ncbi:MULTISPECIES: hypothetical protein [Priestia]|uniref:hypothetical protein n=1 Tax=Priestia TaxID=2800373 RepID=UPI000BED5CCC|nr:hypothetical protein [Priestia megaterium]MBM6602334.1 hypothetical protein [Priestia megaterium]MBV6737718.1 hypothetical protein [Priestia megaterium]MED3855644.1 hypothetical protein [Priestia megaterium]PEB60904.1 hypothetical protein COM86_27260 [Priestia megaterium]PEE73398.1 hypothetical protein COM81_28940 [Priestia megaterium]